MLPEPRRRIRWITREEAERLLVELPEHLRAMARFSLETGVRKANVTGLQWSQVDLRRRCAWIHPDQAKGRKAIAAPDALTTNPYSNPSTTFMVSAPWNCMVFFGWYGYLFF